MAGRQKNAAPPPVAVKGHDPADPDAIVVEDTPATVDEIEVIPSEPEKVVPAEDDGVKALREQLATEQRRREEAERRLQVEQTERGKDQVTLTDSRMLIIDSTIAANEAKKTGIVQRLKEAKQAGDYDAEVTALAELTEVTGDLKQAKLGKDRLETQIEEAKTAPKVDPNADPIDQWARDNHVGQRSASWLKDHREYLGDPRLNAKLTTAHFNALDGGAKVNTDEYFSAIESELGMREAPAETRRTTEEAVPSAPVSRSTSPNGVRAVSPIPGIVQTGQGKYKITNDANGQAIRDAAEMSGIPVADYIKEALKLVRGSDGQLH